MNLEIGNKNLKDIKGENILDIVKIVGAHNHLDYWNEPVILDFNNRLVEGSVVLDYQSTRKEDGRKGSLISFFFNWKELNWLCTKYYDSLDTRDANYKVIRYLIKEGFNVPIY